MDKSGDGQYMRGEEQRLDPEGERHHGMERWGLVVIFCGIILMVITALAYLLVADAFANERPMDGIYRITDSWLVVWNMETIGIFVALLGGALIILNYLRGRGEHRKAAASLIIWGALISVIGHFVYITLGNPELMSNMANDELFSAMGQAVSLLGAGAFLIGVVPLIHGHPSIGGRFRQ